MKQHELELNIKALNSSLSIIVDSDKLNIKLPTDIDLKLDFDTQNNTIILTEKEKALNTNLVTKENKQNKVNAFISEDIEPDTQIKDVSEENNKVSDVYWENGVLKHTPTDNDLPEDIKPELLECKHCGTMVESLTNIEINGVKICKKCSADLKDNILSRVIVNKMIKLKGEDNLYEY